MKSDLNLMDEMKNTALHLACKKNQNFEIIKYLIEQKSDPFLVNRYHKSSIDQLEKNKNIKEVKII